MGGQCAAMQPLLAQLNHHSDNEGEQRLALIPEKGYVGGLEKDSSFSHLYTKYANYNYTSLSSELHQLPYSPSYRSYYQEMARQNPFLALLACYKPKGKELHPTPKGKEESQPRRELLAARIEAQTATIDTPQGRLPPRQDRGNRGIVLTLGRKSRSWGRKGRAST